MILLGHFGRPRIDAVEVVSEIGDMSLGAMPRPPWAIAMARWSACGAIPETDASRPTTRCSTTVRDCPGIGVFEPLPGATRGGFLE